MTESKTRNKGARCALIMENPKTRKKGGDCVPYECEDEGSLSRHK
ncbi:MAG: hypothetical protein WC292_01465 [Clostridia bacterium]